MDQALRQRVSERAGNCCEYCQVPQALETTHFQIDHIRAKQHHGPTVSENLAWACLSCNNHKGPNLAGNAAIAIPRSCVPHAGRER